MRLILCTISLPPPDQLSQLHLKVVESVGTLPAVCDTFCIWIGSCCGKMSISHSLSLPPPLSLSLSLYLSIYLSLSLFPSPSLSFKFGLLHSTEGKENRQKNKRERARKAICTRQELTGKQRGTHEQSTRHNWLISLSLSLSLSLSISLSLYLCVGLCIPVSSSIFPYARLFLVNFKIQSSHLFASCSLHLWTPSVTHSGFSQQASVCAAFKTRAANKQAKHNNTSQRNIGNTF